jgi:two-component system phosphate regulon sensor histidine kinase PhoR
MYKWIIILSVIILTALFGLTWLGYHSIQIRAKGMEGTRLGEFAEVAEQIKQDVKRKLDEFIQTEQNRPYTDYQYYYVPENIAEAQQQMPLLRSPLGDSIYNKLAYGNFQIEPDGRIITPYYTEDHKTEKSELSEEANIHIRNIKLNLLPQLNISAGEFKLPSGDLSLARRTTRGREPSVIETGIREDAAKVLAKAKGARAREYRIQSLEKHPQKEQIVTQKRRVVAENVMRGIRRAGQEVDSVMPPEALQQQESNLTDEIMQTADRQLSEESRLGVAQEMLKAQQDESQLEQLQVAKVNELTEQEDMVKIRIEPFVPLVVDGPNPEQFTFGGQVFMLRHVQIENRHLLQGFQLNEKELVEEVKDSARRFVREGMDFELSRTQNADAAFTAILDFGFGNLVLNLMETDPAWIVRQIGKLRNWYFSIIGIVLLAVLLGLVSLWRNARAQIKLAQKKDDFISAVSHELRTPLTSIRMYSEMLEKNWIKSKEKTAEYYTYMRQESERLSRLIENILDFSRIQKGRKTYTFNLGDINQCIADVVEMMRPYALQSGFSIKTDFGKFEQITFDKDAVVQIIVNLLDNAVKYARDAEDKIITVRTRKSDKFVLIEVEDHGPGIPHRQQKKVFEEFYRVGSEATRETNGTGLGLALVKKFSEAHSGFVEILNAKPAGAVFRVGLAVQD